MTVRELCQHMFEYQAIRLIYNRKTLFRGYVIELPECSFEDCEIAVNGIYRGIGRDDICIVLEHADFEEGYHGS